MKSKAKKIFLNFIFSRNCFLRKKIKSGITLIKIYRNRKYDFSWKKLFQGCHLTGIPIDCIETLVLEMHCEKNLIDI